jgi:C-terminal processing protease CtpA/Prc
MAGVFQPSSHYANQCQSPRTGNDPVTGIAYPDMQGTTLTENNFLRSWTNELYLWYSEVPDVDPATYSSTASYFGILKTSAKTSSGADKDRFHFTYPTTTWEQQSRAGVNLGYGVTWAVVKATPPRVVYVADVWPGLAAASAGLTRGDEVLNIDGVDMVNGGSTTQDLATLNEGLYPTSAAGHTFTFQDPVTGTHTVTLQAAQVTEDPVPLVKTLSTTTGTVGYLLFNDHIATAEQELISAITQLKSAGVTDLVLDIRYNGGGYLDIASELAYMIAGPVATAGRAFDRIAFSAKYPSTNPVTGQALTPTPFHTTSQGFSGPGGVSLPYLGLTRVYVLTGTETCSASEAIMNGLAGVSVDVIQVGSTTCGKPYGFYPQDNCGTTYFSIEFQSENDLGFSGYSDGFSPQNTPVTGALSAPLPGCSVADDFTHQLGDAAEGRLSVALGYRAGQSCPAPSGVAQPPLTAQSHLMLRRPAVRDNLILRPGNGFR